MHVNAQRKPTVVVNAKGIMPGRPILADHFAARGRQCTANSMPRAAPRRPSKAPDPPGSPPHESCRNVAFRLSCCSYQCQPTTTSPGGGREPEPEAAGRGAPLTRDTHGTSTLYCSLGPRQAIRQGGGGCGSPRPRASRHDGDVDGHGRRGGGGGAGARRPRRRRSRTRREHEAAKGARASCVVRCRRTR